MSRVTLTWAAAAFAIQVIQLIVSAAGVLYCMRANRASELDKVALDVAPETAFDGSDIAAAGNVQRERLLLMAHATLMLVGVLSFVIPLGWTEIRILMMRGALVAVSLILLRISATAWRKRLEIIERIRERRTSTTSREAS